MNSVTLPPRPAPGWAAALLAFMTGTAGLAAAPAAPAPRALWTNTALVGTPEPPLPYVTEQILPAIPWKNPLYVAPLPGTDDLWVVLQGGDKDRPARVVSVPNREDASNTVPVLTLERRLIYGLTFHPGFSSNRWVYVFSNGPTPEPERTNRVERFTVTPAAPFACQPESAVRILEWRSAGHDGGDLASGRDGRLYITAGDGTSDSDTWDSGQDVGNLLATLIRIDVDQAPAGQPYRVPPDNPFVTLPGARPEIWAYGFRNPWRLGIDARTGDIWVGQNGQDLWESACLVRRGENYGWSVYEGSHPFYPHRRRGPTPIVPPIIEHDHSEFRSLTGGVVYYGDDLPELNGAYVYGDYATGKIWGARHRDGRLTWHRELADTTLQIAAFRVDQRGRLLVVDHGGGLHRLHPRPTGPAPAPFPARLSQTGLFRSTADFVPHPGLVPYQVNAPGWADGATAVRHLALPGPAPLHYSASRGWNASNGTVVMQTLSLPLAANGTSAIRRIETRLLVRQDNEWTGYTYRWDDDQTDATLVPRQGASIQLRRRDDAGREFLQPWRIPGRAECLACHSRAVNFVLGLTEPQLNRPDAMPATPGTNRPNQLTRLAELGALAGLPAGDPTARPALVDPSDPHADLDRRARSYLHANCAVCHVEAGGGNARLELEFTRTREQLNLVEARPQHDSFGLTNAMLVAPGRPDSSVLLHRISRRGPGQMPPLVTARVDDQAVALMRAWIASLPPSRTAVHTWTLDELRPVLAQADAGRSRAAGKALYHKIGCAQCHRLENEGGFVGPALDGVATRLGREAVLESLIDPSRTIADAYASHEISRHDGEVLLGRIEREDADHLWLRQGSGVDPLVQIPRREILRRTRSPISNMPAGMLDVLERDEVLDLLSYLLAGRTTP